MTLIKRHVSQCHRSTCLAWFHDGQFSFLLDLFTVLGHPRTTHDEHVGTVLVSQPPTGLDHCTKTPVGFRQFRHPKPKCSVAGQSIQYTHGAKRTHVAWD